MGVGELEFENRGVLLSPEVGGKLCPILTLDLGGLKPLAPDLLCEDILCEIVCVHVLHR